MHHFFNTNFADCFVLKFGHQVIDFLLCGYETIRIKETQWSIYCFYSIQGLCLCYEIISHYSKRSK